MSLFVNNDDIKVLPPPFVEEATPETNDYSNAKAALEFVQLFAAADEKLKDAPKSDRMKPVEGICDIFDGEKDKLLTGCFRMDVDNGKYAIYTFVVKDSAVSGKARFLSNLRHRPRNFETALFKVFDYTTERGHRLLHIEVR